MERYTEKVDGIWSISCKYEEPPYPVVTQEVINRLAAYEDTGLEPEEIQKLKAEAANGQQMKNLLSRNGFRDLSEAQAWIEQMKKLESNIEYYGVLDIIEAFPTLTPQNDPLTIEELREMDGEPVYIISEFYHISEWNIPNGIGEIVIAYDVPCAGMKEVIPSIKFIDGKELAVEKYGSSWVAYRRPPEVDEDI